MKHAYLIMAYNEYEQLNYLLRMLDHPDNILFVHVDKKSPRAPYAQIQQGIVSAEVHIYQEIRVYWGHYSQTACEIFLLERALEEGFDYCHMLSGSDLPLVNQETVHEFFETHKGMEFVGFYDSVIPPQAVEWLSHYHPIQRYLRLFKYPIMNKGIYYMNSLIQKVQTVLRINRIKGREKDFQKGTSWFSITSDFAKEVILRKEWIEENFNSTRSSDEIFIQTILLNSKFNCNRYEKQYEVDGLSGTRYIDWKRGKPYTFRNEDFDELINSEFLFARKFSMHEDAEIVKRIYKYICQVDMC